MSQRFGWMAASALLVMAPISAMAADSLSTLRYAVSGGTPNLDVRTRWEWASQAKTTENADAFLGRARLGYNTGKWNDFDLMGEFEGTFSVGAQAYNSGTTANGGNNKTGRAPIADPTGTELNQLVLRYSGLPGTVMKFGRQRIILDNQRFVGNVGWRMNEQTYDAFNVVNTLVPKTTFNYSYLSAVHPPSFVSYKLNGHAMNVNYKPGEWLSATGYGYLFDFDNPTAARANTQTYGLRLAGTVPVCEPLKLLYTAEYAHQYGYKNAPPSVGERYFLLEAGAVFAGVNAKLGYEMLGGDGTYGFQTPLATLHAFQGWADQFLNTPVTGIHDSYVRLEYTVPVIGVNLIGFFHNYASDSDELHFGEEYNIQAVKPINDAFSVTLKYADFQRDQAAVTNGGGGIIDTRRAWVQLDYKF